MGSFPITVSVLLLAAVSISPSRASAQTASNASIRGYVHDATGAVLHGLSRDESALLLGTAAAPSYLGSSTAYVGVMAQEVESLKPEAVTRGSDGYLRVYYEKLGLKFRTYSDWLAGGARMPAEVSP